MGRLTLSFVPLKLSSLSEIPTCPSGEVLGMINSMVIAANFDF